MIRAKLFVPYSGFDASPKTKTGSLRGLAPPQNEITMPCPLLFYERLGGGRMPKFHLGIQLLNL
jgi:hypothetical protein